MFEHPVFEGLKVLSVGKTEAWREFQFLEVMGTNPLGNEVVWQFSNLSSKTLWEWAKRVLRPKHALGGITNSTKSTCRDSNYIKLIYNYWLCVQLSKFKDKSGNKFEVILGL